MKYVLHCLAWAAVANWIGQLHGGENMMIILVGAFISTCAT